MSRFYSLLVLVAATFYSFSASAQTKIGRVTGVAKSADGKILDGATISLLKAKDSSLVKAAVANKSGEFEIEKISNGKYLAGVTAVGYSRYLSNTFEISDTKSLVDLDVITLKVADKNLVGVQVVTRRPLIEIKIDKTVVNVDAAVTNIGTSAMDVLEKSPGISVDKDGNIGLKGKQGVIILIDNKPTYLSGQDLANYLRNLSSGQLDQIEIMSQPSAKYDASGNSGIINIRTKKNNTKGFNGSITLGYTQGVYPKSSNSFNINSRKGKWNVFANYSYSYYKGFNTNYLNRKFHNQTTKELSSVFDQTSEIVFEGQPHNIKTGVDFFASKNTTVGIVLGANLNVRKANVDTRTNILSNIGILDSFNNATTTNKDPWNNYSGNLNFRQVIDKKGKELSADLDYVKYITGSKQNSDNYIYYPDGHQKRLPYLLKGDLPSDINIYSAKVDYVNPLKKGAKIEAGLKSSYVETDNNAKYTYWDTTNKRDAIDPKSNHFIYKENINAAYINANKQYKKIGVQLGLRLENTTSKGNQVTDNSNFNRTYTQLFPTAYFSYAYNTNNNFSLSYGKRIDRPNYQDMNPFKRFLDQYTYMQGNPYLTPQFSHNIELSHNYKGQLNTSVNYTRTTDIISDVLEQNDTTKVTFQTKKNVATRRNIGLSISYNKPLTKIWTISAFGNLFNNFFKGVVNNEALHVDGTTYMVNLSNQFKFNKGWAGELSGWYRSKSLEGGTIIANPMGTFSFGASKQIMKTKGTIRLSVRDPFYLQKFSGYSKYSNIDLHIRSVNDTRQVSVAFVYRFGKNQNNVPQRKRNSSSQDEQNRVGQSNN